MYGDFRETTTGSLDELRAELRAYSNQVPPSSQLIKVRLRRDHQNVVLSAVMPVQGGELLETTIRMARAIKMARVTQLTINNRRTLVRAPNNRNEKLYSYVLTPEDIRLNLPTCP